MYLCQQIEQATQQCAVWVAYEQPQFLPEISSEARDALLLITVSLFLSVFLVHMILKLVYMGNSNNGGHHD